MGIDKILSGDPIKDPRTPDIIVLLLEGVIYADPRATKIAEHGGFTKNDTNLAMLSLYAQQVLLAKLESSRHNSQFVLKGALSLFVRYGNAARPTENIESLLGTH